MLDISAFLQLSQGLCLLAVVIGFLSIVIFLGVGTGFEPVSIQVNEHVTFVVFIPTYANRLIKIFKTHPLQGKETPSICFLRNQNRNRTCIIVNTSFQSFIESTASPVRHLTIYFNTP